MTKALAATWVISAMFVATPAAGADGVKAVPAAQSSASNVERDAALARWATLTPPQRADLVASARSKAAADLTAIERVALDDAKANESARQKAEAKAQADAARKAKNKRKQEELAEMERLGQRN